MRAVKNRLNKGTNEFEVKFIMLKAYGHLMTNEMSSGTALLAIKGCGAIKSRPFKQDAPKIYMN